MKKIMFVGAVGTGKTTLTQRLLGDDLTYQKTQAIQYETNIIDTPGEFTQRRNLYSALQVTSVEADVIGLLLSVDELFNAFPPTFATMFSKPCIGIVTKIDLAESETQLQQAEASLKMAGATKIFRLSSIENKGIEELAFYLSQEP